MQRQHRVTESFAETVDTDQEFVSNNTGMSQRSSMNNFLNPVENRLSNNTASYDEASCINAVNHNVQSFSGWNSGESSSRLSLQNQAIDDGAKMEDRWASSFNTSAAIGPRSEERRFDPNDIFLPGRVGIGIGGNQIRSAPSFLQGSSSNNISPNLGYLGDSSNAGHAAETVLGPTRFNSVGVEIEQSSTNFTSDVGPSGNSGYLMEETSSGSGSSLAGWGLSCKRKALEGTSGQSFPGGSSSCFPQTENVAWHTGGAHHNASSSLSLSPPSRNSPSVSPPELSNTRMGLGMRGVASDNFPSSTVTGNADSVRSSSRRFNAGHQQESLVFNLSTGGARRSNAWSVPQPFRSASFSDSLDFRSIPTTNSNASQGPLPGMQTSASSRNISFPWNGSTNSRAGNSSSSFIAGERGAALREDGSLRSMSRTSAELPMFVPVTEMRYMGQDPSGWSLATGNMSASPSVSSTRISPSSSIHPLPAPTWFPHQNHPVTPNHQRFSEFAPWSLFPSMDSESGGHNVHFPPLSSGPSVSSQETVMNSGSSGQGHNQQIPRAAFVIEGQGDDVLGMPRSLRALAADIEGRHRLISEIRQVLNAMRRGENLRIEDYMLFDPFMHHGMAEMHDRHRDMRLDVDNMSYEELLALEERIGDVSTGLSEGTILKLMKQQKYFSMTTEYPSDMEPCSICQEEYADMDELGKLECGHDFHTKCIKQWLMLKNICPICKMTALPT
ncbi:E3 ubiquitin-protein ligase MBR2 [Euphorbia lathyris]|uniref:E3 ubiquitin-protein ligase MBR2 n=1 Tax=Euphorbia lathyris TaxID=212925 RepID=UPI003313A068